MVESCALIRESQPGMSILPDTFGVCRARYYAAASFQRPTQQDM